MVQVRIRERDLAIPALRAAADEGGEIKTSKLIEVLTDEFQPTGEDAQILDHRNDTKFSQIVRNLVSHKNSSTSIFAKGYAVHNEDEESLIITDAGRAFLGQSPDA